MDTLSKNAPRGARTLDFRLIRPALYQLSYRNSSFFYFFFIFFFIFWKFVFYYYLKFFKSFNKHSPQLINIYEKYDKNTEVVFIAVKEKKPLINKYITKRGISIQVAMDKFGRTFKKFYGKSIPLLVVIDKKGIILHTNDDLQDGFENDLVKCIQ